MDQWQVVEFMLPIGGIVTTHGYYAIMGCSNVSPWVIISQIVDTIVWFRIRSWLLC